MWTPPEDELVQNSGWTPPTDEAVEQTDTQTPSTDYLGTAINAGKRALTAPIKMLNPEIGSKYLPTLGAMTGNPIVAGGTAIAGRMADLAYGRVQPGDIGTPIQEAVGPMATTALTGISDVKGLTGIRGTSVPEISPKYNPVNQVGKFFSKGGQTLSGLKQDVIEQGYKQGLSTYMAPSMDKAQDVFGEAIGPEGKAILEKGKSAEQAFDPAITEARNVAKDIGIKYEKFMAGSGEPPTAMEALKARQATDRVISATQPTDKTTRRILYGWRDKFDNLLSNQGTQGEKIADASRLYRQAVVKDKLLSATRLNKSGEPSAFLPMLIGHSLAGRGIEGAVGLGTFTSPALWGLGATTLGTASKVIPSQARNALLAEYIRRHGGNNGTH